MPKRKRHSKTLDVGQIMHICKSPIHDECCFQSLSEALDFAYVADVHQKCRKVFECKLNLNRSLELIKELLCLHWL